MRIAFIIRKLDISTPLGIMCLSAVLKKNGHKVRLICFNEKDYMNQLKKFKPDILAYSITTGIHKEAIEINKKIKKHLDVYSIFGGPHATFYPDIIKTEEGIDAICRGEGESSLINFLNKLKKSKEEYAEGFWVKKNKKIYMNPMKNLIENLDELPFPDREIIYEKSKFFAELKIKRFITKRGCPFSCTYCFNKHYNKLYFKKGKIIRERSVDNVISEIKEIKRKYVLDAVKFIDDTFNLNSEWLNEFCNRYGKEIGLPFICNIRADLVTEKQIRTLAKAGCMAVYMGVETGNEKIREEILKRKMSNKQIIHACRIIKKKGIKIVTQNMLGLPSETLKESFETIKLNAKCKVDFAGFSIFQPYPDTPLTKFAIENNYFDGNFNKLDMQYLHHTPLNYSPNEKKQLENLSKFSTLICRYPLLIPFSKFLIRFPKNKIFNLIYKGAYAMALWKVYSKVLNSGIKTLSYMTKLNKYLTEK